MRQDAVPGGMHEAIRLISSSYLCDIFRHCGGPNARLYQVNSADFYAEHLLGRAHCPPAHPQQYPLVLYFSKKTPHDPGLLSLGYYQKLWSNGELPLSKAPDATLTLHVQGKLQETELRVSDPKFAEHRVSFKSQILRGKPLHHFGSASLFIKTG